MTARLAIKKGQMHAYQAPEVFGMSDEPHRTGIFGTVWSCGEIP